ncbi:MAG: hypothetical protein ACR2P7_01795, partial [bacterium]
MNTTIFPARSRARAPAAFIGAVCLIALGLFAAPAVSDESDADKKYLVHVASGKCVHPTHRDIKAGKTKLMVHDKANNRQCFARNIFHHDKSTGRGEHVGKQLWFRHDAHARRLRHHGSGLCVMPEKRELDPKARTKLVLDDCASDAGDFIVYRGEAMRHVSGLCIHILPGRGETLTTPNNGASLMLDYGCRGERVAWNFVEPGQDAEPGHYQTMVHRFSGLCVHPQKRFRGFTNNTTIKLSSAWCENRYVSRIIRMLPNGALFHFASNKCLHPHGGRLTPFNDTRMVLHTGCTKGNILFRHLENGALQHRITGKCLVPR